MEVVRYQKNVVGVFGSFSVSLFLSRILDPHLCDSVDVIFTDFELFELIFIDEIVNKVF